MIDQRKGETKKSGKGSKRPISNAAGDKTPKSKGK